MAYNVLKGNVQFINSNSGSIESMVDNYSNHTIAGVKTFSSAITASAGIKSTTNIEATSGSFAHLTISSSVNQTPLLVLEKGETESSFIEFKKAIKVGKSSLSDFGIIISGLSTFFATQRYLNLKTNANY